MYFVDARTLVISHAATKHLLLLRLALIWNRNETCLI